MNLILVNPPIRLPVVFAHYPTMSPLGLLSNAAWLRQRGYPVRVADAFTLTATLALAPPEGGFRALGGAVADVVARAAALVAAAGLPPSAARHELVLVVGLSMFSEINRPHETFIPETVAALRAAFPNATVGLADFHICGMNYFPYDPAAALAGLPGADWIVVGEGEPTLPALLARLAAGGTPAGLARVAWRDGAVIHYDPTPPTPIAALDDLPPPAFDLIDMDHFFAVQADAIRAGLIHEYHVVERLIPLMTSRGCPFRCHFCTNQVLDLPWRAHSVPYLQHLIRDLRERYGVDRFLFLDDNINVAGQRFRDLVAWLADIGVPWDAVNGFRADQLDREMVRAIKAAGNTKVTVSAESGDPALLSGVIRKRLKLSAVIELARITEEERIPLQVHYILGVPGETKAQINKTLEFATRLFELHGAWPLLQHAIPFPGTALWRDCEENGYFARPPHEISGAELETASFVVTPEFSPAEVLRMKHNGQQIHAATQAQVFLDVASRCTARCPACLCLPAPGVASAEIQRHSAREGYGRTERAPSRRALAAKLDRARFLGAREVLVGGGEPTLRRDLRDILLLIREMGFARTALFTNAHGIAHPAHAARVLQGPHGPLVDRLVVALLAHEPARHDALARPVDGAAALTRTLAGVAEAVRAGVVALEAHIPILRDNLDVLWDTVKFARGLGIRTIRLVYPQPDSRAFGEGQVVPFATAREPLLRAVALGRRLQTDIAVQGAPLCLLPEYPGVLIPSYPHLLRRARPHRVRHPVCRACTEYILCGGFFRPEYDAAYGVLPAASAAESATAPQREEGEESA
jgi:radical SAM superfamily enzyme YgiQ (UPF0313 family)